MKREAACALMLVACSYCLASRAQVTQSRSMAATIVQDATPPDLVIRQVVAVAGDDKRLRAHIVNIGGADAGVCNLMLYYRRAGQIVKKGTSVPPIQKGKDLWVDVNNDNLLVAASAISLRIDDPDRIKESNELNNSYKFK